MFPSSFQSGACPGDEWFKRPHPQHFEFVSGCFCYAGQAARSSRIRKFDRKRAVHDPMRQPVASGLLPKG
jgi:hypothetical protein